MKMFVISDNNDTLTGMRLAGVDGMLASSPDKIKSKLEELAAERRTAIVFITPEIYAGNRLFIDLFRRDNQDIIVSIIPDKKNLEKTDLWKMTDS